jgi:hypothetical protein
MAVGLIVISPLLSYLHTSYNLYTNEILNATGYLTVDAMMEQIFSDMYAGEDIYILNKSESNPYNQDSWLNGFDIITVVNNSIAAPPPPPSGGEANEVYMDPGCGFELGSLEHDHTYFFELYLTENSTVTVNWYFKDEKASSSCNYYCNGSMWIEDSYYATVCGAEDEDLSNGFSTAFQQQLNYTVPVGGTGNYFIYFKNLATRKSGSGCSTTTERDMSDFDAATDPPGRPTFSGIGEDQYTWVHLVSGSESQGVYQDYTITTTARKEINDVVSDVVSITACVRQTPGPLVRHHAQTLAVVSWIVEYH